MIDWLNAIADFWRAVARFGFWLVLALACIYAAQTYVRAIVRRHERP